MACKGNEENHYDRRYNQFQKILLVNDFANEFGYFMVQCGAANFMDSMDMKCGAIPQGDFEQVIDQNAAHQFLELYMHVAEYRLAYAVTEVLKIKADYIGGMKNFAASVGKENWGKPVADISEALSLYGSFVLDGMPCDETKEFISETAGEVQWKIKEDTHTQFWEKAGGDVNNYYALLEAFVSGLLDGSGFAFAIKDGIFSIKKC